MKKTITILSLLCVINLYSQIQISNFTHNNVPAGSPAKLQEFNNRIFFSAVNDNYGRELWSSDGTSTDTNIVSDISPGVANGLNTFFTAKLNNELYFVTKDNASYTGGEIWKTNGTTSGTTHVTNYSGRIFGLTTVGNFIYLTIKTDDYNLQIWKTDGTQVGTTLVKDSIAIWNVPTFQGSVNDTFIFTAQVYSSNNCKVWRSDGTTAGTYELTGEIDGNGSGGGSSELSHYIMFNNNLYFVTRYFLYKTDGTLANTSQVASVWNAQMETADFGDAIEVNGKMYLSYYSKDLRKLSIYQSDGTQSGTSEIYTVTGNAYFYASYLNKSGNNLIFTSINPTNGTSLFYLNTTNNAVSEVIQIDQNPQEPLIFTGVYSALTLDAINGTHFFVRSPKDQWPNRKGWIFNETDSTLNPIPFLDNVSTRIAFNNYLYFSKNSQLWKLDTSTLSISEFDNNNTIEIYPNPTSDFINFNQPEGISEIKIYNINGKLILETPKTMNNKIDVRNLISGTYFLEFKKDNKRVSKKIIIAN